MTTSRTGHVEVRSLGGAARSFVGNATPRIFGAALAALVAARIAIGHYGWFDLVVVGLYVAVEPFAQWLIHVFVLHARPIRVGRISVDLLAAREHRRHHADPRDLRLSLIPLRVLAVGTAISLGVIILWPTSGLRLTAAVVTTVQILLYEWTHYLIHTDDKPQRSWYRRLYTHHRLHHYRNEHYWFGVSRTLADTVLRTAPDKDDVAPSPTARRLLESVTAGPTIGH